VAKEGCLGRSDGGPYRTTKERGFALLTVVAWAWQYRDSSSYLAKMRQLQSRGLGLVKNQVRPDRRAFVHDTKGIRCFACHNAPLAPPVCGPRQYLRQHQLVLSPHDSPGGQQQQSLLFLTVRVIPGRGRRCCTCSSRRHAPRRPIRRWRTWRRRACTPNSATWPVRPMPVSITESWHES
jgi:hypothetical protein